MAPAADTVCPSVRLSVCFRATHPPRDAAAGLLPSQEISVDGAGGQQQPRRSTARSSKCGQLQFVSQRTLLNTDLFDLSPRVSLHPSRRAKCSDVRVCLRLHACLGVGLYSGVTVSLGAPWLDLVGGPTSTFS